MRGLIFEIASVRATFRAEILGELVEGWSDEAQAIVARYFAEPGCVGCGLSANACTHNSRDATLAARRHISSKAGVCIDCAASIYRDAFLDAIAERAVATL